MSGTHTVPPFWALCGPARAGREDCRPGQYQPGVRDSVLTHGEPPEPGAATDTAWIPAGPG